MTISSCPPDFVLSPMEAKHGFYVTSTWARRGPGALEWNTNSILRNPGMSWGAFSRDNAEGDPVASVVGECGYLRALHTDQNYRRKGLAKAVSTAAARTAAKCGFDVHCNIEPNNCESEAFHRKLGFKVAFQGIVVVFHAPGKQGVLCKPKCVYCLNAVKR